MALEFEFDPAKAAASARKHRVTFAEAMTAFGTTPAARARTRTRRYADSAMAVVLDPDVAAAFPSAEAVNDVPRTAAGLIREHPPARRTRPRRSA